MRRRTPNRDKRLLPLLLLLLLLLLVLLMLFLVPPLPLLILLQLLLLLLLDRKTCPCATSNPGLHITLFLLLFSLRPRLFLGTGPPSGHFRCRCFLNITASGQKNQGC